MTRLHPDDIELIAEAVARRFRSGPRSPAGIDASGIERDPECDEATNGESMDRTSTANSGGFTSLEAAAERGRRSMRRLQRAPKPTLASVPRATKRKASP